MKKSSRIAVVVALALCFVLMSVSTVFADTWSDPTVTGPAKAAYTSTVLTPVELPGIVNNDSTAVIPAGLNGMYQFGGNGLQISGASSSDLTLTFSFPAYSYGWTGSIYRWDGKKWDVVNSTLVKPAAGETLYSIATTAKVGNGIYALLITYK